MKNLFKPVLLAGLVITATAPAFLSPASAQQTVQGVGVVNLPAAIANSSAYQTAEQQRSTTYQAQIDQANQRRQQLSQQLQPLYTAFQTAQQNQDQAAAQQNATQIAQIEQAGQRELQTILQPVALSRAYVQEQIEDQLEQAVQNAAQRRNITLILDPTQGAVIYADAQYNITQDVVNELNTLLPSAQLVPPQGWVPREIREQQAAAAAAQGQQHQAPAPAAQQPTGR